MFGGWGFAPETEGAHIAPTHRPTPN